jgi:hypothetical protein
VRDAFEKWYKETGWDNFAVWHEPEQRYSLLSLKQTCWTVWQAAFNAGAEAQKSECENNFACGTTRAHMEED